MKKAKEEAGVETPQQPQEPEEPEEPTVADYMEEAVEKNTYTKDKYGNEIVIPKDFRVVPHGEDYVEYDYDQEEATATNIPVVQDGIVIEHKDDENQFVWVPVGTIKNDAVENTTNKTEIKLGRYENFTMETNNTPPKPTQEASKTDYDAVVKINTYYFENSTGKDGNTTYGGTKAYDLGGWISSTVDNGGYYIARYEASYGINEDNSTKALSQPSTGTPSPEGGSAPTTKRQLWNFVTQPNAAKASQDMYPNQKVANVEYYSDLVNSYAWNTAIIFIQTYSENKTYANQASKNSSLANTGERGEIDTDRVCNIYDIASNIMEWTTETYTSSDYPCVYGGGHFDTTSYYAGSRINANTTFSHYRLAFRPLLYVRTEQ